MNAATIRDLRYKFIVIATFSFFCVILFTAGMTVIANESSMRTQAGNVLGVIVENEGNLPEAAAEAANAGREMRPTDLFRGVSAEYTYAARYFSVIFDPNGQVKSVDINHMASVDYDDAVLYAKAALESYQHLTVSLLDLGQVDTFYYRVATLDDGSQIAAFLDCSFQMQVNRQVGLNTAVICVIGLLGSFVLVVLLSKRMIRPSIENARKQKQFITNASHELKTPLAVIRANTEVIEMLQGESEWTHSTMSQVDRMDGLVQNLVMIARAEEREDSATMSEIDVGKVVLDSVAPFQALARQESIGLRCNLAEDVRMVADASAIQQLCTLLVDNAIKYCDEGGDVVVDLTSPRRGRVVLAVSNSFAEGDKAEFGRYFERFYRDDEAHSDEGGYGIGLSVAESICTRYRGGIKAAWKGGMATFTCQLRSA